MRRSPTVLAVLLLAALSSWGQIALDTTLTATSSPSTAVSTLTFSYTMGSVSNGLLGVCVGAVTNGTQSSVTYNGVAMTLQQIQGPIGWWTLVNPSSGAHNVVVTLSAATNSAQYLNAYAISLSGVNQSTPIDTTNSGTVTAATISTSVTTTVANDWAFECTDASAAIGGSITAGASQTSLGTQNQRSSGTGISEASYLGPIVSAGAQAMSSSWSGSVGASQSVIAMVPAGSSPTLSTPTFAPTAGAITAGTTVTINIPAGSTGCYTVDGTTPAASTPGTCSHGSTGTSVVVTSAETIKAIATEAAFINSAVGSAAYTIAPPVYIGPGNTTATCIDHDGDGYGVGPGCTGPDADDSDATVNTYATVVSKYGGSDDLATLKNFWAALSAKDGIARSPAHYIFISTAGNDAACTLGQAGDLANSNLNHPCLTEGKAQTLTANGNGDAVIWRAGSYTGVATGTCAGTQLGAFFCGFSGTALQRQIYASYPGEAVTLRAGANADYEVFSFSHAGTQYNHWLLDGLKIVGQGGGSTTYGITSAGGGMNDGIIQNVDMSAANDNIWIQTQGGAQANLVIQNNVIHNSAVGTSDIGHGLYIAQKQTTPNSPTAGTGFVLKGNLIYNNYGNALHLNGLYTGALIDSNIISGCGSAAQGPINCLNFQMGLQSSTVQNNVMHTAAGTCIVFIDYNQNSDASIRAYNINFNTVRGNTCYFDGLDWDTGAEASCGNQAGLIWVMDTSASANNPLSNPTNITHDLGHNTYDSNVVQNTCTHGNSTAFRYDSDFNGNGGPLWLATDTWRGTVVYNGNPTYNPVYVSYNYAGAFNATCSGVGALCTYLTLAQFNSTAGTAINNVAGNPAFIAIGTYSSPLTWNLALSSSASAAWKGGFSDSLALDVRGVSRGTTPDAGAYQSSSPNLAIPITVSGTTQTQIVIQYTVPSAAACTVGATDNNGGPVVADLNATLFTNANQDLSRTVANGFLWPTLVNGLQRTVVIGTHDQIKKGLDGNSYSTALQTGTNHTITVSCNSGVNTGTVQAETAVIPYGSYYPELPIPDSTQIAFGMQPTVDWVDRTKKYIDPISGVLIQRVSGPADAFATEPGMAWATAAGCGSTCVIDVAGSAWTNRGNFTTNQVSGTLATTSTVNAPIFAPFDPSFKPDIIFDDFDVILYGNASAITVQAAVCISVDSGQTCANATPQLVTFGTSVAVQLAAPPSWQSSPPVPGAYFSGWGGLNTWFGTEDLTNRTVAGVSCSGTPTVCTVNGSGILGFNVNRAVGSSFAISSCGAGANTTFTVATLDSWQQITTQQSAGGAWTNCTLQDLSVGIRVTLNNAGTLNVSLTGNGVTSRSGSAGSNGERWIGGLSKVTDIATDCNGTTQSPNLSGYLVSLGGYNGGPGEGIYLIQDNGTMCLQSNLINHDNPVQGNVLANGAVPFLDSRCFLTYDGQTPPHIWKACHIASTYTAITPNFNPANTVDNFTWTDLGTTASNIGAAVISAGGAPATALSSGLFGALALDTVGDDGNGHGIIQYRATAGGASDAACMLAWADATNTFISALTMWGTYPFTWGACHFSAQQSADYSQVSAQAESSQLSPIHFNATLPAGGPFVSRSSAGLYKNGSLTTWSISISGCTNASPTVCTSTANDLDNVTGTDASQGAWVQVSGATGSWTPINGAMFAHKLTNNTFSLYSDPIGTAPINAGAFGSFTGTVTATMLPPLYSIPISSVLSNGGNARIVADLSGGPSRYFPSGNLPVKDGDPVTVVRSVPPSLQTYLHSTTQYYAKVSSAPAGDIDIFSDSALSAPVSAATFAGYGSDAGFVIHAQACPDPVTLSLPGPMYMDTGIGTTGAGNQYIRCEKIRLHDEGCSDFPATGEHAVYPCASDSANTARSSLHQIHVGDAFGDLSHYGGNHEILYVLAINRVSTNQIDVTVERDYGDDPNYGWRAVTNGNSDTYAMQHSPGWTPWAEAAIPVGLVQTVATPTFAIPPINGAHNDFVPGFSSGNVSQVSGYESNVPNSSINVSIATISGPSTFGHSSTPYWSVPSTTSALTSLAQSYPSMRTIFGQTPASELGPALSWNGDWMAMNGAFGNGQNNGDGVGLTRTLTNIRGGTYDPGSATSIVFLVPTFPVAASLNIKISPILMTNWPSGVFTDMSGPGSLISDASQGSSCTVYVAGECRPSSTVGQVFVAMRRFSDYGSPTQCVANNATVGVPCAFGLWSGGGWAVQIRNNPVDIQNVAARRLTLAWTLPLSHYSFSNWISTPDGKWGLFAGNPIQQHPPAGTYTGTQWFAMKIPPSPPRDSIDRATYVPQVLGFNGVAGDTVRIQFGYAENGNPTNFYCTSRAETCYTSLAATPANPFVFASETQHPTPCATTCSVSIPAIPGRTLYYRVVRANGANQSVSAMTMVAVP